MARNRRWCRPTQRGAIIVNRVLGPAHGGGALVCALRRVSAVLGEATGYNTLAWVDDDA